MVPIRRHARHWRTYLAGGGLVLTALLLRKKRTDREHDDNNSYSAQKNKVDKELQTHSLAESNIASAAKSDKKEKAKRTREASERGESDARKFLFRLTVNEAITVLMTVASLVISYLTYRNAADTSQMRDAVNRLSQLHRIPRGKLTQLLSLEDHTFLSQMSRTSNRCGTGSIKKAFSSFR